MLTQINPKLPMRDKAITKAFYLNLGFTEFGASDYDAYLMLEKDAVQIHFFKFSDLNPLENYGQVYIRTNAIDAVYQEVLNSNTAIHPNGKLELKPWRQKEFSILDPDHNLLTFGEVIDKD